MTHIAFIVEQALGHITHGNNLQRAVQQDNSIQASWGLPTWSATGFAGKVNNWTLKAGLQTRQQLRHIAQTRPIEAIFFHTQVTAVLSPDWVRRIPSIISLDATPLQYDRLGAFYDHTPSHGWSERAKFWLNRTQLQQARHLVTWSQWAKESLVHDYAIPASKITVIPPGVILSEWNRPTPRTPHDGPLKLLFVGGNLNRKGGDLLLQAFHTLRQEGHAVELHLVTRDDVASADGLFVYRQMQPNSPALKQLYYDCDLFCLPTRGDCLPMVLSEAGATGLPVIATRVAAIPELVQHEESGLLVSVGDVAELTHQLRTLIVNPHLRQQMGHRALELVRQQFDATRNAEKLVGLLKQIARPALLEKGELSYHPPR